MRKRVCVIVTLVMFIMNHLLPVNAVYADESVKNEVQSFDVEAAQSVESGRVYVENGEGDVSAGEGTASNPYKNIRTALDNIQSGQTLVLAGDVVYTKYDVEADGSAAPLFINKNITIMGATPDKTFKLRTAIQLGADVTFKDMHLEMVPEVTLGGGSGGTSLGTTVERSATIYAAGHTLILDGVNTALGTAVDQDSVAPYISGGAYKGRTGTRGNHAVIKVLNPTEQTKFSAIYAGDYWQDISMNVDIELDAPLVDKTIHTAGIEGHTLNGNVNVVLGKRNNIAGFDHKDQIGELNVTIAANVVTSRLECAQVNNLILEKASRINIPQNGSFLVNNVTLKEGAVLDFREMSGTPEVQGNFQGVDTTDSNHCGAVLIGNSNTLTISGNVNGLTRLNTNGAEAISRFVENHTYVEASDASAGDFTITGTQYTDYEIKKEISNGRITWFAQKKQSVAENEFDHFKWADGQDTVTINLRNGEEFYYPIEFYDKNDQSYKPDSTALLEDFAISIETTDGRQLSETDISYCDWDEMKFGDNNYEPHQIVLSFQNLEKDYGKLMLKVEYTPSGVASGVIIEKEITVLSKPGHHFATTWSSDGTHHWKACTDEGCIEKNEYGEHKWNTGVIAKKATWSADGSRLYTCSVCKATRTEVITKVSAMKLSATSYIYDGKAKTPTLTVKDSKGTVLKKGTDYDVTYAPGRINVGSYKVTVVLKGKYSGSKELRFTIKPKTQTITRVDRGDKNLKITWTKGTKGVTGYEIYRSTSLKGTYTRIATIQKIGTVSYTNKGLKANTTYYYKVRSYVVIGGKKIYGAFSPVKKNKTYSNTEAYVARNYTKALGRNPEPAGLQYWTAEITAKRKTPIQVAGNFIYSKEFRDKKLNNTEYVKVLYRTFMGREADKGGLDYWVGRLSKGESRERILKAFAACPEFQKIIKGFGL